MATRARASASTRKPGRRLRRPARRRDAPSAFRSAPPTSAELPGCPCAARGECLRREPDELCYATPALRRWSPRPVRTSAQPRTGGSPLGGHLAEAARDAQGPRTPQRSREVAPRCHRRHRWRAVSRRDARRTRRLGRERAGRRRTGGAAARTARACSPRGSQAWRAGADSAAIPRGGQRRTRTLPRRPASTAQRVRGDRTAVPGLSRASRVLTAYHALLLSPGTGREAATAGDRCMCLEAAVTTGAPTPTESLVMMST